MPGAQQRTENGSVRIFDHASRCVSSTIFSPDKLVPFAPGLGTRYEHCRFLLIRIINQVLSIEIYCS